MTNPGVTCDTMPMIWVIGTGRLNDEPPVFDVIADAFPAPMVTAPQRCIADDLS